MESLSVTGKFVFNETVQENIHVTVILNYLIGNHTVALATLQLAQDIERDNKEHVEIGLNLKIHHVPHLVL